MPMSRDALRYGRGLAAKQYRHPNDRLVTADLFERWNLGFGQTLAERRMALRMARDQAAFAIDIEDDKPVAEDSPPPAQEAGDDDAADFEDFDGGTDLDEDAFYADALEDL